MKKDLVLLISILLFAISYSFLRYVYFKGVEVDYLPLYILNKSFSMSFILLIPYNLFKRRKLLLKSFNVLLVAHITISLFLFDNQHYAKFFTPLGNYSLIAILSVLFGVISLVLFINLRFENLVKISSKNRLLIFLIFTAIHILVMGVSSWFTPKIWPGYMPPITLISFISALYSIQYILVKKYSNITVKKLIANPLNV